MKLLLDTHAFLYWDMQKEALSDKALELLEDPQNDLYLSLASIWEIQIKLQIGKLSLKLPLDTTIQAHQQTNQIQLLNIVPAHIYNLSQLPFYHKDPFDRILLSQAMTEGFSLLSQDTKFAAYGAQVVW